MTCLLLGSVNYLYVLPARGVSIGFQVIKQGLKGVRSWETHPEPTRAVTVYLTFLKSHLLHNTCCAQVKCRQRQSTTSEKHKNDYENPSPLASGTWPDTSTACVVLRGATTVSGSVEQAWRFLWSITGQETVQASLRSVQITQSAGSRPWARMAATPLLFLDPGQLCNRAMSTELPDLLCRIQ